MVTIKIYKLINPIDNYVFYVGKTVMSLSKRLNAHIKDKEASKSKRETIDFILMNNLSPIIELIESHTFNNDYEERKALLMEDFWIREYSKKYNLCNSLNSPNPRLLSNYQKTTNKTKPIGIRFEEDEFEFIKDKEGLKTAQQVASFLIEEYAKYLRENGRHVS